jgi:hypothetical protein
VVSTGHSEPADVEDRLLWRDAQDLLGRHAEPDLDGLCVWCGSQWPCPPRRLAERAEAASRRPWRESWTARHDMNSFRSLPSRRADVGERGGRLAVNRGLFD